MQRTIGHVLRFDWLLMGSVFLLIAAGLTSLFSLRDASAFPFFERQIAWVAIGVVAAVFFSMLDYRLFKTQGFLVLVVYAAAVALLGAVLAASTTIRGVEAWLVVGGFSVQPVEIAKLALILLLAKFFSKRHLEIYRVQHLAVSGVYAAVPAALVGLQPDLGSVAVMGGIWVIVILFSGMKLRHFFVLVAIIAVLGALSWNFLEPYQKSRIVGFLDPYRDPRGAGYQMLQSMIAVGSGESLGKGLGYGSQSHLNFLPEAETDFIFAAFAEEWGFAGTALILALIGIVLWRIVRIGFAARDNFSRLFALGFAAWVFVQSFIHIGMNMGALPITGLTLPFVSYGGSSMVALLAGVGIMQNIKITARREIEE